MSSPNLALTLITCVSGPAGRGTGESLDVERSRFPLVGTYHKTFSPTDLVGFLPLLCLSDSDEWRETIRGTGCNDSVVRRFPNTDWVRGISISLLSSSEITHVSSFPSSEAEPTFGTTPPFSVVSCPFCKPELGNDWFLSVSFDIGSASRSSSMSSIAASIGFERSFCPRYASSRALADRPREQRGRGRLPSLNSRTIKPVTRYLTAPLNEFTESRRDAGWRKTGSLCVLYKLWHGWQRVLLPSGAHPPLFALLFSHADRMHVLQGFSIWVDSGLWGVVSTRLKLTCAAELSNKEWPERILCR